MDSDVRIEGYVRLTSMTAPMIRSVSGSSGSVMRLAYASNVTRRGPLISCADCGDRLDCRLDDGRFLTASSRGRWAISAHRSESNHGGHRTHRDRKSTRLNSSHIPL